MKIRMIALAAMVAACGSAVAGTKTYSYTVSGSAVNLTLVDAAAADTVVVRMSGASATRSVLFDIAATACGGAGSVNGGVRTMYYNVTPPAAPGAAPSFGGNLWAVTCRLPAAFGSVPANTDVAFFKTDAGGSAQGVFPISTGVGRPFLATSLPTSCTTPTTATPNQITGCTATSDVPSHVGISDVEPKMFAGINVPNDPLDPDDDNYPAAGLSDGELAALTVSPVIQTVFGVAVNTALYNTLFTKQGLANVSFLDTTTGTVRACTNADFTVPACTPSIGYAQARTLFSGSASDWGIIVPAADALVRSPINICRRVQGSGTQASANAHLMGIPCNTTGQLPPVADFNYSNPPTSTITANAAVYPVDTFGQTSVLWSAAQLTNYLSAGIPNAAVQPAGSPSNTFVFEGPGTGDVVNCLNRAQTVGGYAIGHVSKENAPGSNNWRHVRLEGAFPSRDNLKSGDYDYAFESTVQYKNTTFAALSANQRNYITKLIANLKTPASLSTALGAQNTRLGVAALPDSYAGAFGTGTQAEIDYGSRVSRGGNSCTPFTAAK